MALPMGSSLLTNFVFHYWPAVNQSDAWFRQADRVDLPPTTWVRDTLNAAASGYLRVPFQPRKARPVGRPKLTDKEPRPRREQFQLQAAPDEIQRWKTAAATVHLECSEWCRQVLDHAALTLSEGAGTGGKPAGLPVSHCPPLGVGPPAFTFEVKWSAPGGYVGTCNQLPAVYVRASTAEGALSEVQKQVKAWVKKNPPKA